VTSPESPSSTSPAPDSSPSQPTAAHGQVRGLTLWSTNAIKLVGAAAAFNELLLRSELRPQALAIIAFMMAGAQVSEGLILSMVDRFLGRP
jgi:hypothetical protein